MHPFRAAVEAKDFDAAVALFADDATLDSPVAFKPFTGVEQVSFVLRAVGETFEDFQYTDEFENADGTHALIFNARVGEKSVQGLDLIRSDDSGRITNLTVMVRETLSSSGLPPSSLCLEITESMLMRDHVAATRQLNELRELGVRLAIDDFGTGYSSLAQLRRLPLDTLKIDRSFVSGLGGSRDAEAIVTSIIAMAHAVDLTVVAEGVETEQQLDVLQRLGCDLAQGYYFGRPARAVDVFR